MFAIVQEQKTHVAAARQLLLNRGDDLSPAVGVALALLEQIVLAVQLALALVDSSFLALNLFAAAAGLDLPLFTQLDQLFFPAQDSCLAQTLRFAVRLANDSLRAFFRGRLSRLLTT